VAVSGGSEMGGVELSLMKPEGGNDSRTSVSVMDVEDVECGIRGKRTRRIKRKRRKRKVCGSGDVIIVHKRVFWNVMLWNARGLEDELAEVITYMEERGISLAGFMETKVFGTDLSRGRFKWIPGPETLPTDGDEMPRMGLGVLVDTDVHRCAAW
jgi:hypothetical protein